MEWLTWLIQQAYKIGAWPLVLIFIWSILRRPKPYLYTASHHEEFIARLVASELEWKELALKTLRELEKSNATISECLIKLQGDNARLNQKVETYLLKERP